MAKELEKVFVKPAIEGQIVRDERSRKPLEQGGEWKPLTNYWVRRLRMKDVVKTPPPSGGKATTAKTVKYGTEKGKK